MIRHLSRLYVWLALAGLALMLGCSKSEPTPPTVSPEQVQSLQQKMSDLGTRVARLNDELAEMQRQQLASLTLLTSESQSLTAQINEMGGQIGVRPVPLNPRAPANGGVKVVPAPAPKTAEQAKGLSPWMRLLLIIIALFALWIIVRIFLGRMAEEEEDEDEFFADSFDEEQTTEEGTIRISPQAQVATPVNPVPETPKEEPAPEEDKDKPQS